MSEQTFSPSTKRNQSDDKEFTRGYDEDLNTTLIFAGLFSAVTSAFIIDVQNDLKPDYTPESVAWLQILAQQLSNSTIPSSITTPQWSGPDPIVVDVQTLLYSSLSASLMAAFVAALGKQWLNRYIRGRGGSVIERSLDRQRKWEGMKKWRFHIVESLLLMLQVALLLLGCALSRYLWTIDHTVAIIPITFTSLGVIFHVVITISATISYECPFQTPLSTSLRSILRHNGKIVMVFNRIFQFISSAFTIIFAIKRMARSSHRSAGSTAPLSEHESKGTGLSVDMEEEVELLFEDRELDFMNHSLNARCIVCMSETSTDLEVTLATMAFVPEVEWYPGIDSIPSLTELYGSVIEYFDFSTGRPVSHAGARNKAYITAKAFLHLYVQRCSGSTQDILTMSLPFDPRLLGIRGIDDELNSTLCMMDGLFRGGSVQWYLFHQKHEFSLAHISWMCRILVYHTWQCCRNKNQSVPYDDWFLEHCLSYRPSLPGATITDCLLMLGLRIGLPLRVEDLSVIDKNDFLPTILKRFYTQLAEQFQDKDLLYHTDDLLRVVDLLALWEQPRDEAPRRVIQQATYSLCRVILDSPVSEPAKWDVVRTTIEIAFRGEVFYNAEDASGIFRFLLYLIHLPVEARRSDYDDSVVIALDALTHSPADPGRFEFVDEYFCEWVCWSIAPMRPTRLKHLALGFLHEMRHTIFQPSKVKFPHNLCADLSSALRELSSEFLWADRSKYTEILAQLATSPVWHPHLFAEHLEPRTDIHWIRIWLSSTAAELRNQIIEASSRDYQGTDPLFEFDYLPSAWLNWTRFRRLQVDQAQLAAPTTEFINLMALWVKAAWDFSSAGRRQSELVFDVTEELYQCGGEAAVDDRSMERWLQAAWTQFSTGNVKEVVKDATTLFFHRRGQAARDDLRSIMDSMRDKLREDISGRDSSLLQLVNATRMEQELEAIYERYVREETTARNLMTGKQRLEK